MSVFVFNVAPFSKLDRSDNAKILSFCTMKQNLKRSNTMDLRNKNIKIACFLAMTALLAFAPCSVFAKSSYETQFHNIYDTAGTAIDSCALCHPGGSSSAPDVNSYGQDWVDNGQNSSAFLAIEGLDSDGDGFTNIDEINARTFPGDKNSKPTVVGPVCTDEDGDGFALEGGACGPIDCNDSNFDIKPNAVESCSDSVDNDCDGLVDRADPNAVNCTPLCTDNDNDGYAIDGDICGPVDCNDNDAAVNPGAIESCTDGIDNNCNSLIDDADPSAENCPVTQPPVSSCTDADNDGFNVEGSTCGPVDCNDDDPLINPDASEDCIDGVDNNCNGLVDASDPNAQACPAGCTDIDLDGYAIEGGGCGPIDCNDSNPAINPGATDICGDSIDQDCSNADAVCPVEPLELLNPIGGEQWSSSSAQTISWNVGDTPSPVAIVVIEYSKNGRKWKTLSGTQAQATSAEVMFPTTRKSKNIAVKVTIKNAHGVVMGEKASGYLTLTR
jgi:hypothetical protein